MDVLSSGLPIRIMIAISNNSSLSHVLFQKEIKTAKQNGIGLILIDEDTKSATIFNRGVSAILTIPTLNLSDLIPGLRSKVKDAHDMYMSGDPKHGVQELGQLMEKYMKDLADDAIKAGKLKKSEFKKGTPYRLAKLIDELIEEKVIDRGVLGNCRGFVYSRNETSHPQDLSGMKRLEKRYKDNFLIGLNILKELPTRFKEKGFRFKP